MKALVLIISHILVLVLGAVIMLLGLKDYEKTSGKSFFADIE